MSAAADGDQHRVDARVQAYYGGQFDEDARLGARSAQGRLERERTQEIITARLAPGSRVLDVGGATGVHAAALTRAGHHVHLIDPVASQVDAARALPVGDDSVDAVLLLGPLYHLVERCDRVQALQEAARVVRPGGRVFAAAIPRLARLATLAAAGHAPSPCPPGWIAMLEDGAPEGSGRFPAGHFHTRAELEEELASAGLVDITVQSVEGPAGPAFEQLDHVDEEVHQAAMNLARTLGHLTAVCHGAQHMIATATVTTADRAAPDDPEQPAGG